VALLAAPEPPKLTLVGSLEVTTGRWAAFAPNASRDVVEAALTELEQSGKVVIDHETGELLIRTFTTHDLDPNRVNVNLARGLWGQWACLASDYLRHLAVLLIPDKTWEKLEPHAPSDAAYIRRSARLEPGEQPRSQPATPSRFEPPPSSLLPPDYSHPPAETSPDTVTVDNPTVAGLVSQLERCAALASERNPYPAVNGTNNG
jgi:hypothetical protein